MGVDLSETKRIIEKYRHEKGALIPLLQEVEAVYGYVPKESMGVIARELGVYPVDVYGIVTFYTQFHLAPRGRHTVRVCQGTACHVMGGREILDYLVERLGIRVGDTTADGVFTLERVACLGCCGMAPVVAIDEDFHGRCAIPAMDGLLDTYRLGNAK